MATIRQLAQLAGVSIWTVSLALRDDPRVRPEVRQRIKELAELYHYRSNRLLQGALTGNSGSIGCLIPSVHSPFFSRVLEGVLVAAFAESYEVIPLQLLDPVFESMCKALQTLTEKRVEGVLIASSIFTPIPKRAFLELWSHDIIPISLQASPTEVPIDHVQSDWQQIAHLAVDHIYRLGHRHIVYAGSLSNLASALTQEMPRWAEATLTILTIDMSAMVDQELAAFFQQPALPTACIAQSDMIAARFIQQAHAHRRQVPRDISVISCASSQFRASFLPPLTAINQQPEEIGRSAANLLFRRIAEGKSCSSIQPETILIAPEFIPGKSCARPRKHALR
jgi:DNA-binding LacI/PurR family transcriptional regulator